MAFALPLFTVTALSPSSRRSPWALALVLALLVLSAWGQLHRVLHAGPAPAAVAALAQSGTAEAAHSADGAVGGHDEGSSLCQLLDQLSQGAGLLPGFAPALAQAQPAAPVGLRAMRPPAGPWRTFAARDPPPLA